MRFPEDVAAAIAATAWWDWPREVLEERIGDFNDLGTFLKKYAPR
jgi:hypothetical protein